jgi:VIT1/CCC1 family predicted Fe2+/Mn2+ transporter
MENYMFTRNLDKAKEAYKNKDIRQTIAAHKGLAVSTEEHNSTQGKYIKSIVYGGLDGTITTFAAVAGVAGAALKPEIVLIMGFANLVADGLSMAIGDYLSTKAEIAYSAAEREREAWEVEHYPEGEKLELIELYVAKGMEQKDAEMVTEIISKHKKSWVDIMMVEELGIMSSDESPVKNALVTFCSFSFFGFLPILAYIVLQFVPSMPNPFIIATAVTGMTLFSLGAIKVKVTGQNWFLSGLEMFMVGGVAAASAYGVGAFLNMLVK